MDEGKGRVVIHLIPSKELAAFKTLAVVGLARDGAPDHRRYGAWASAGADVVATFDAASPIPECTAKPAGHYERQELVVAHVAGATVDPPAIPVTVPFDCPPPTPPGSADAADAGGAGDASPEGSDASADEGGHGDAGVDDAVTPNGDGCAVVAAAGAASGTAWLAVPSFVTTAVAMLARRSRRSRPR